MFEYKSNNGFGSIFMCTTNMEQKFLLKGE